MYIQIFALAVTDSCCYAVYRHIGRYWSGRQLRGGLKDFRSLNDHLVIFG